MRLSLFFFSWFFLFSCLPPLPFNEVKINNQYLLSVPSYMEPCSNLNPKASLQLQSTENDLYLIMIDEEKEDFQTLRMDYTLNEYLNKVLEQPFIQSLKNVKTDTSASIKKLPSGFNCKVATLKGKTGNYNVIYKVGAIETPDYFYQIVLWTREGKLKTLDDDMIKIIRSFREAEQENADSTGN